MCLRVPAVLPLVQRTNFMWNPQLETHLLELYKCVRNEVAPKTVSGIHICLILPAFQYHYPAATFKNLSYKLRTLLKGQPGAAAAPEVMTPG